MAPAPHLVLPAPCSGRISVPTSVMGDRTRALRARGLSRWHSWEGRSREPNAAADLCFRPASSLTARVGGAVTPRCGGESAERAFQHLGQGWAWPRSGDSTKPSRSRPSGGQRPTPLIYTLLRPRPPPCSSATCRLLPRGLCSAAPSSPGLCPAGSSLSLGSQPSVTSYEKPSLTARE